MVLKTLLHSVGVAALGAVLLAPSTSACAQNGPYKVVDHWKVGGEGSWDYLALDESTHLLYLTHGPRVEVVDTATGKTVGAITDLKRTHGVVFDPGGKYGYISDGDANAVVVFDRKTFAKVKSIAAGTNPDGMVYEPVTKTIWAFNGKSSDVTVIDTEKMTVAATIKLPGKPEFPVADGKGKVFDNIETKNALVKLDARTLKLEGVWPLAGCESPSGLVMDLERGKLFSVCDEKKAAITDAKTGKQLALVTIGDGPDAAGYDAKRQIAFSSNEDGTLTVVSLKDYKVLQNLKTVKGARTMAYDAATDRIYLSAAELGERPAPSAANPKGRPVAIPGSFGVVVVGRK